ncbi:glycosyltransferase [Qipengyuania sp. 6B39]|uniref:glycosyltransferase n=1 Tax=Qipengyuania proteolytica TaxID=2867239 RepID=UPI001C8ACF90|nr:glycosyltransferase [Qipengyuania proteolytica]
MFEAIVGQVALLHRLGAVPVVIAVQDAAHGEDSWRLGNTEIVLAAGSGPDQLAYSPELAQRMVEARLDLLHLHGIWQYPSRAADEWAQTTGLPLVISPHGMLDPWITARNAWKKGIARFAWERAAWARAAAFHALTTDEASDIERETGSEKVEIIPNPAPPAGPAPTTIPPPGALYLGRIHPKKNILALIEGWLSALPDLPDGVTLTIAGWGDSDGIRALERALVGIDPSVAFVGAVFGSQKAALLDVSRFVILPSLSEGLPMAVLDAWAAGVPTIMSQACHLPEGYEAGAAIPCETSPESIAKALVAGFGRSESEWLAMARAAQDLASGPFGSEGISGKWEALYAELLKG